MPLRQRLRLRGEEVCVNGLLNVGEVAGLLTVAVHDGLGIRRPPASRAAPGQRSLGLLAGTARIRGDVVAPAAEESDWEALRAERRQPR